MAVNPQQSGERPPHARVWRGRVAPALNVKPAFKHPVRVTQGRPPWILVRTAGPPIQMRAPGPENVPPSTTKEVVVGLIAGQAAIRQADRLGPESIVRVARVGVDT